MIKSWKTTLCGLVAAMLAMLSAVEDFSPKTAKILVAASVFAAGCGNLFSRDADKTSEQSGLKPEEPKT